MDKLKNNKIAGWIIEKRDYFLIVISALITIPVILPYFHAGYFPTHDGEWAVVRLADMFRTLRDLQIPARYSGNLNFGYGYPLFNFDYPFPYYFAVLFHFAKLGFVDSIKLTFAITVPISSIGMYLLSKKLWGSSVGAFASSMIYVYLPYRMVDLYVRGSIGESIAFAVAPFIFWGLYNVYLGVRTNIWIFITAVSYAILITSHNIDAVLFSIPLLFFFIFLYFHNKKRLIPMVLAIVMGVLLSSFFSFPALLEKSNILLSKIPIADRSIYFVQPLQLINSPWGYEVPADKQGAFTYQIGYVQIILLSISLIFMGYSVVAEKWKKNFKLQLATLLIVTTLVLGSLLFSFSNIIWSYTPLLSEINYPWILIGIIGFLISVTTGFIFTNKITSIVVFLIAISSLYFVLPDAKPRNYVDHGDGYYFTNDATTTSSNEVMPIWVTKIPLERYKQKVTVIKGQGKVSNVFSNSKEVSFDFNSSSPAVVEIATIYYPGWQAFSNNREKAIFYDNPGGLINIKLTSGRQNIKVKFGETITRLIADIISLLAFCGLIFILIKYRDKN